jgi:thiamine-monophosphate kinase
VLVGPGDDAAVLTPSTSDLLVTTDMLMEGSCFRLAEAGPVRVGRKAMAVNLSDIAAMAGRPIAAFVSVGLPRSNGREIAESLFQGMRDVADHFDTAIAGGDTNSWDSGLVISITIVGHSSGRGPVLRKGALPGDWLFVTGPLGGSIRGKHLDFTPRVTEALRLHGIVHLHAMIDISDGLGADLGKLCAESRCGALVRADDVPITDAAREMADSAMSPLDHALADGEDFELLLAVSPADGERLLATQPIPDVTLTNIGVCVESGLWIERATGREPLEPRGYEHELR